MNSRAENGEPSVRAFENFTFHGQQFWELCRDNLYEIALDTGARTVHLFGRTTPLRRRRATSCGSPLLHQLEHERTLPVGLGEEKAMLGPMPTAATTTFTSGATEGRQNEPTALAFGAVSESSWQRACSAVAPSPTALS